MPNKTVTTKGRDSGQQAVETKQRQQVIITREKVVKSHVSQGFQGPAASDGQGGGSSSGDSDAEALISADESNNLIEGGDKKLFVGSPFLSSVNW